MKESYKKFFVKDDFYYKKLLTLHNINHHVSEI